MSTGKGLGGVLNHDTFAGAGFLLLGAGALQVGGSWGERAWLFPNLLSTGLIISGAILLVRGAIRQRRETVFSSGLALFDAVWFVAGVVGYFAVLDLVGYPLATAAFLWGTSLALGGRPSLASAALKLLASVAGAAVLYALFGMLLKVPLPTGMWM